MGHESCRMITPPASVSLAQETWAATRVSGGGESTATPFFPPSKDCVPSQICSGQHCCELSCAPQPSQWLRRPGLRDVFRGAGRENTATAHICGSAEEGSKLCPLSDVLSVACCRVRAVFQAAHCMVPPDLMRTSLSYYGHACALLEFIPVPWRDRSAKACVRPQQPCHAPDARLRVEKRAS